MALDTGSRVQDIFGARAGMVALDHRGGFNTGVGEVHQVHPR